MTGDGKADVFWVDASTGGWHISDGGTQPLRRVNGAPGIGVESYQLADMTGDGKADVFLALGRRPLAGVGRRDHGVDERQRRRGGAPRPAEGAMSRRGGTARA